VQGQNIILLVEHETNQPNKQLISGG